MPVLSLAKGTSERDQIFISGRTGRGSPEREHDLWARLRGSARAGRSCGPLARLGTDEGQ
jgi:hypothetical protein